MLAKTINIFRTKQNFFFIYDFKTENEFSLYLVVESRNGKDEGKKNESLQRKHAARPTLFALLPVVWQTETFKTRPRRQYTCSSRDVFVVVIIFGSPKDKPDENKHYTGLTAKSVDTVLEDTLIRPSCTQPLIALRQKVRNQTKYPYGFVGSRDYCVNWYSLRSSWPVA